MPMKEITIRISEKAEHLLQKYAITTGFDDYGRILEEALFTIQSCLEKARNVDRTTQSIPVAEFKGLLTAFTRFERDKGY